MSTTVLVGAGTVVVWPGGTGRRRLGLRLRLRLRLGEVCRLGPGWSSSTGVGGVGAPGQREAATLGSAGQLRCSRCLGWGRAGLGIAHHLERRQPQKAGLCSLAVGSRLRCVSRTAGGCRRSTPWGRGRESTATRRRYGWQLVVDDCCQLTTGQSSPPVPSSSHSHVCLGLLSWRGSLEADRPQWQAAEDCGGWGGKVTTKVVGWEGRSLLDRMAAAGSDSSDREIGSGQVRSDQITNRDTGVCSSVQHVGPL